MDIIAQIKKKIEENLAPSVIEVLDESSMHGSVQPSHLRVLIVSDVFVGMSSLKRHQKVFEVIGSSLLNQIHAFSQQTYTLKEWKESSSQMSQSPPCHRKNK